MKRYPKFAETMTQLGQDFHPSEELQDCCEEFTCSIYGKPGISVNDVRYSMFCSRSSQCYQLPPTKDALRKHVARSAYQAAIWRRALVCDPAIPSPNMHGWILKHGQLCIDWMSQQPAPQELVEIISCGCKSADSCTTARCSCFKNSLPCTDCCGCLECGNSRSSSTTDRVESDEESCLSEGSDS